MAATPAGTQIQATGSAKYQSATGSTMPTAVSNTATTTVQQTASVSVSPSTSAKTATPGAEVTFGLSVANSGNGADAFDLSAAPQNGSTVAVYRDDNGDGIRQSTETTKIAVTPSLGIGQAFKCLLSAQLSSGGTDTITFTAKSQFDPTKAGKSTLTVEDGSGSGAYVLSWLLNGYYPNADKATRLSKDYLGSEAVVGPLEGSASGGKTWFRVTSTTEYVDLYRAFGSTTYCAAYAFAYVYSPSPQTVNLWVGSNDGIKVWVNARLVLTKDVYRSFTLDKDRTTVSLVKGWTKLLVKISQATGSWGFSAKLCDSAGNKVPGLAYALAPISPDDRTPPAISGVTITPDSTSATVAWKTDELSSTLADYDTTTALAHSYESENLVRVHSANLTGLTPGAAYCVKIGSADAAGNVRWSGNYTFQTTGSAQTTGPYVRAWLLNGYYPNADSATRLSKDYLGGESSVSPTAGSVSGGKTWFRRDSPTDYLDLAKEFGGPYYCAAYAHTYVYSSAARTVAMWMGSNDGIKVWLNGTVVWNNNAYRSFTIDKDKTNVALKAGWNRLLVKVSQATGSWGASVKLCDAYGNPVTGLIYAP
jgi:hypothetical protein